MTAKARSTFQAIGLAMFLGVILGALANGNPFGVVTYILACVGLVLWMVMTFAVPRRAES